MRIASRRAHARTRDDREIVFVLVYAENPRDAKFDPPDRRRSTRPAAATARPLPSTPPERSRLRATPRTLVAPARTPLQVATTEHPRRPHGQHLERLPVHGHVQPVAIRVVLRVGHRPRMGFRDSNQDLLGLQHIGARARREHGSLDLARHNCPPVARTTSTTVDEARERRRRFGVQRRSPVVDPRGRGLPEGDRRLVDPRRNPSPTTTREERRRRSPSTSADRSRTRSSGSDRTACP